MPACKAACHKISSSKGYDTSGGLLYNCSHMDKLKTATKELIGITLSPYQISLLEEYERELQSWNDRFNLTAFQFLAGYD